MICSLLASCGSSKPRCANPPIPAVGTTGHVTVELTADHQGVQTKFRDRQWVAIGIRLNGAVTAVGGTAIVQPGTPLPVLRVETVTGQLLTLRGLPVACA
jgi:hypothetical protein